MGDDKITLQVKISPEARDGLAKIGRELAVLRQRPSITPEEVAEITLEPFADPGFVRQNISLMTGMYRVVHASLEDACPRK